jgi:histidyl-tRNA synthetase
VANQFQVIRGMHDILPSHMPAWNQLEDEYRALAESYGYRQIRTPIVEKTALFARSIGTVTDIVEKESGKHGQRGTCRPAGGNAAGSAAQALVLRADVSPRASAKGTL